MIERLEHRCWVKPLASNRLRRGPLLLRLGTLSGPGGKIEVNMFFLSFRNYITELKGFAV